MLVLLALLWLCLGAVIGLIAHAARLQPGSGRMFGWTRIVALGALTAFCGGWLGILLLGRPFATVLALLIAVIGVVCIPWLFPGINPCKHFLKYISRHYGPFLASHQRRLDLECAPGCMLSLQS